MSEHIGTDTPGGHAGTEAPSDPPRTYRRLTRRVDQKIVAGVCAGLGEYFDVDPVLFRVGFVVLVFVGGLGLLLYLLAWWMIPRATGPSPASLPHGDSRAERAMQHLRGAPAWVGVALLILGGALVANQLGVWHPAIFWGVALIGLGVLLFVQEGRDRTRAPRDTAPEAGATAAFASASAPAALAERPLPPPPETPDGRPPPAPPARRRPRRERSPLGWITLGVAVLTIGVVAVLNDTGAIHLAAGQFAAIPLTVIGLGLVVGAWWGRARWLIVLGVLVVPFVLAFALIDVPFAGGSGQRSWTPTSLEAIETPYRLVGGESTLDLTQVAFDVQHVGIIDTMVAGRMVVIVPGDVTVDVHAHVGAGQIDVFDAEFGQTHDGLDVTVDRTFAVPASTGHLTLDLRAGFGQIEVVHAPAAPPPTIG